MKDAHTWQPTKYRLVQGQLLPSMDPAEVGPRSRLIATLQADAYQRAIQGHARGRLVDLGCGKVPLYETYRQRVDSVVCVDWPDSLHANPHIDIEADLNDGFPLADAAFDTIIATDVLEHLRDPFLFWREVRRVLAPGGKIILAVPFLYWLHEEPHDHYRYTRHRLALFCAESELTVIELEEYGGPLSVVLDIVGKNTPWAASTFQRVACAFLRSRIGRRIDERQRGNFPIGYVLVAAKEG